MDSNEQIAEIKAEFANSLASHRTVQRGVVFYARACEEPRCFGIVNYASSEHTQRYCDGCHLGTPNYNIPRRNA